VQATGMIFTLAFGLICLCGCPQQRRSIATTPSPEAAEAHHVAPSKSIALLRDQVWADGVQVQSDTEFHPHLITLPKDWPTEFDFCDDLLVPSPGVPVEWKLAASGASTSSGPYKEYISFCSVYVGDVRSLKDKIESGARSGAWQPLGSNQFIEGPVRSPLLRELKLTSTEYVYKKAPSETLQVRLLYGGVLDDWVIVNTFLAR